MYYKRRGEAIAAGSRKSAAGSVFDRCRGFSSQDKEKNGGERERQRGRTKERKKEGGVPRERANRKDGEFAHADGIRKLASAKTTKTTEYRG